MRKRFSVQYVVEKSLSGLYKTALGHVVIVIETLGPMTNAVLF